MLLLDLFAILQIQRAFRNFKKRTLNARGIYCSSTYHDLYGKVVYRFNVPFNRQKCACDSVTKYKPLLPHGTDDSPYRYGKALLYM